MKKKLLTIALTLVVAAGTTMPTAMAANTSKEVVSKTQQQTAITSSVKESEMLSRMAHS